MSLDGAYDDQNIFAKIIRGEIPAAKIYEDARVLAFMDVFPQSRGHCLVVSKVSRARNLLEIEPDVLCGLMQDVQRVAKAVVAALNPDGMVITQFNGAPAGQTVFHMHVHIIPRWADQPLKGHGHGQMADAGELKALAEQIAVQIG
jgi:histidine triad (HIT) family protein